MAVAKKYEGKPICFIAVNSGNDTKQVSRYVRDHKVTWPTIVDSKREVEAAFIKGEISTSNIMQFRTIDGEGTLRTAGNLKSAIEKALANASWNVDPSSMPMALKQAWQAIEFGNFPVAAKAVNASLKSKNEEVKTAATTLNEYVQEKLQVSLTAAKEFQEQENGWGAYKAYLELETEFKGYIDDSVNTRKILKELKSTDEVKMEIAAMRQLDTASNTASRSGFESVVGRLKKIVSKYPDTEAAATAEKLLSDNGK